MRLEERQKYLKETNCIKDQVIDEFIAIKLVVLIIY